MPLTKVRFFLFTVSSREVHGCLSKPVLAKIDTSNCLHGKWRLHLSLLPPFFKTTYPCPIGGQEKIISNEFWWSRAGRDRIKWFMRAHFIYGRELSESYRKAYIKTAKPYRNVSILTELRAPWKYSVLEVAESAKSQSCFPMTYQRHRSLVIKARTLESQHCNKWTVLMMWCPQWMLEAFILQR